MDIPERLFFLGCVKRVNERHHSLERLADAYGIESRYRYADGRERVAPESSLRAVLRALGAEPAEIDEPEPAIARRHEASWRRVLEPVNVVWNDRAPSVRVRLPESGAGTGVASPDHLNLEITHENGTTAELRARVDELRLAHREKLAGGSYAELELALPELPVGKHRLQIRLGPLRHETTILTAPVSMYAGFPSGADPSETPAWGLFAPLHALRSARSDGGGHLGDLRTLVDWGGRHGATFFGTLPLLASYLDEPFEPSPYVPVSRQFWNELFIDLGDIPEMGQFPSARSALGSPEQVQSARMLDRSLFVDYESLMALRRRVLEELASSFWVSQGTRRDAFERWCALRPDVEAYARFRAVTERLRCGWTRWPGSVCEGPIEPGEYDEDSYRYHLYVQWVMDGQLSHVAEHAADRGGALYLDLPVGVHEAGFDTWQERELFVPGMNIGAPPDSFFSRGQDWGIPPLHPGVQRDGEYDYFARCLQHHMRHAGILRVDHVMGLRRLFWVPHGADASDGVYVRYPADELLAVLSLASHRARCVVVGEDLGTVPPEVRDDMHRHDLARMYVAEFELRPDEERVVPDPPRASMVSVNTHDLPTFASFLGGRDIESRRERGLATSEEADHESAVRGRTTRALVSFLERNGLLPASRVGNGAHSDVEIHAALISYLGRSGARFLLVNLEDLWGEAEPQNVPGTGPEQKNWRRRMQRSLDELEKDTKLTELLRALRP